MGIFNLPDTNSAESKSLVSDALALTVYSYHNLDDGLANGYQGTGFGLGLPITLITAILGNCDSQGIIPGLPWNPDSEAQALENVQQAGWTPISAEQLGYSGITDSRGTFFGENAGYKTAQAEILGKYDEAGNLTQIGIAFRGTSGPRESLITDTIGDVINDLQAALFGEGFSENFAQNAFGNLLKDVAKFASENGLTGENVVVSGHSLGGLAVNSLAALSDSLADGFYSDSHYVAFASPTQYEVGEKVLNVGFENDPVFRVLNGAKFELSSLFVHDMEHSTTTDNIVNFNDYYASNVWNALPFSIVNLPAWLSHMPFLYDQCISSILSSEFYDYTSQDSTIIVSALSDATRDSTWVRDINRYAENHNGPTFIIGSDYNDYIKGGYGIDYLEGGKGDDIFRDDGGYNMINGGSGTDTFDTEAQFDFWSYSRDLNGDIWLKDLAGNVSILHDVEQIKGGYGAWLGLVWHEINGTFTEKGIDFTYDGINAFKEFNVTNHASLNADSTVIADTVSSGTSGFLFGYDGNDTIIGSVRDEVIAAGDGDDVILNCYGSDTIIVTGTSFGHDEVHGFGTDDKLVFMGNSLIVNDESLWQYVSTEGNNLVVAFNEESSVTLIGAANLGLDANQLVAA